MSIRSERAWHIGPLIDCAGYAFGWVWLLVPTLILGPEPADYVLAYIVASALSAVHVHFTFPYVYLDPAVHRRGRFRFAVLPLIAMLGVLVGAVVDARVRSSVAREALALGGLAMGAWNVWHVLMQKYGILRLYDAKRARHVPGLIDRLLVFSWLAFLPAIVARSARPIMILFGEGALVSKVLLALAPHVAALMIAAIPVVAGALVLFVWAEGELGPRAVMALGTCLLSLVAVVDPVRGFLCYLFSHALEYMVFVWAVQRRKFGMPHPEEPPLARLVRRPIIAYGGFVLALGGLFAYAGPWAHERYHYASPRLLGLETSTVWVVEWITFASALHFYFDGFLWKMRSPEVRELI